MDADDKQPQDNPPVPQFDKEEESHPVVWTPEDASRFLTSAIREAQRPLADALAQRPVTTRAMALFVGILVVAAAIIGLILSNQISKTEQTAEKAIAAHNESMAQKITLQTRADFLESRLSTAQEIHERLRGSVDELKRVRTDIQRFRRQNELLRGQISGLEMEKMALSRQVDALKALALDSDDDTPADDYEDLDTMEDPFRDLPPRTGGEPAREAEPPAEQPAVPIPADPVVSGRVGATESPPGRAEPSQTPPQDIAIEKTAPALHASESTPSEPPLRNIPQETAQGENPAVAPTSQTAASDPPPVTIPVATPPPLPELGVDHVAPALRSAAPAAPVAVETKPADTGETPRIEISKDIASLSKVDVGTVGASTPVELRTHLLRPRATGEQAVTITGNPPSLYEASRVFEEASREFGENLEIPSGEMDQAHSE